MNKALSKLMTYVLPSLLIAVGPIIFAQGQTGTPKTQAQMASEINTLLPSGIANAIAAEGGDVRQVFQDVVTSYSSGQAVSITDYGAVCNGTADDTGAIQNALNAAGALSQGGTVTIPSSICHSASGIVIPSNVRLIGSGWFPGNPQAGSQIQCAVATAVCVQVGTPSSNGVAELRDLGVTRKTGTPGPTTVGILVRDAYNVVLEHVGSFNHGICYEAETDGVTGISLRGMFLDSGACVDVHFLANSWPEIYVINSRFGMDGTGDFNANAYIRLSGGANGPNTVTFANTQFNQGVGSVGTFLDFKNLTTPKNQITSEFKFIGNHIENVGYAIQTDISVTQINKLKLIGNLFVDTSGNSEFWHFGTSTVIYDLNITDNSILHNAFTFSPGGQISTAVVSHNQFLALGGGATFNAAGGGNAMSAQGNIYNGSVTISGSWSVADFSGEVLTGRLTNSSTGSVSVNFPGQQGLASCASTLGLAINASTTGITYGTRACTYQVQGNLVTVNYNLELTSKGVATGNVTLVGLPFTVSPTAGIDGGAVVPYVVNCSGLAGFGISISPAANTTIANLYTGASTGIAVLKNTNLTNTSNIAGTFTYRANP
jgi:hypothetical protein